MLLPTLALIAFILALYTFWLASRKRKASGVPAGRLVYSDTSRWRAQLKPLYDPELGLTGRPDYIFEDGRSIIPVEVKSSRPPDAPYESHKMQLAAYCLLIQREYNLRPPYGVLHYIDRQRNQRTFAVDYTPDLEDEVIDLLADIRRQQQAELNRSHQSRARCNVCGYRSICDQRLA